MRPLGRTQETAQLGTFLRPGGPGPRILLLSGEAGSGKTTLLDEGRTTAAELFMGKRTVEAHLSQVYRKYQVRSRAELARKLPRPAPTAE